MQVGQGLWQQHVRETGAIEMGTNGNRRRGEGARERRKQEERNIKRTIAERRKWKWRGKGITPVRGATSREEKGQTTGMTKRVEI